MTAGLIVFDLDGTLHWTEKALTPAIQAAMADMGLPPAPAADINPLFGEPLEDFCRKLLGSPSTDDCEAFRQGIRHHQARTVPSSGMLYPGTARMLQDIDGMGFAAGVCSNSRMLYIDLVLESLGIGEMIRLRRGIEGEGSKTARVAGMVAESGCGLALVAGDRYHDMAAAAENGIPGIWCSYGYGGPDEGAGAAFRADSPADIASVASRSLAASRIEELVSRTGSACPCVGISGWDASGKTEFALFLSRFLEAGGVRTQIVHMDDFHNPREVRRKGPDEIEAYLENAFDTERLCRELLEPAHRGCSTERTLTVLDLERDTFDRSVEYRISPGTVVIVEGVLLFRDPVDRFLDVRVFLDVPDGVILERAASRDGPEAVERYRSKYLPVQRLFEAGHDPRGRADLIIDNTDPGRPGIRSSARGS